MDGGEQSAFSTLLDYDTACAHCRPFNPGEARDAGATVERENRRLTDGSVFYVMDGKQRFTQGYLQRQCAISSLRICETLPPLDELQRFKQARSSTSAMAALLQLQPCHSVLLNHSYLDIAATSQHRAAWHCQQQVLICWRPDHTGGAERGRNRRNARRPVGADGHAQGAGSATAQVCEGAALHCPALLHFCPASTPAVRFSCCASQARVCCLETARCNFCGGTNARRNPAAQGDRVKVVAGDLAGMKGRVVRIDEEGMVHVKAQDLEGVNEAIEIEPRDLVKFFNVRRLQNDFKYRLKTLIDASLCQKSSARCLCMPCHQKQHSA